MNPEEKKFIQKIRQKVGKAINDYNLINEGDSVLLGLSGGKDSLCLLDILAGRRKFSPLKFKLKAAYIAIDEIPYSVDRSYIEDFAAEREVELIYHHAHISEKREDKKLCFICSWTRRKALFEIRKDLNINKITLGHHRDDAIATLMMNMLQHGTISSFPPKLLLFNGEMELIRPLYYLSNAELEKYSTIMNFQVAPKTCPHGCTSNRLKINQVIQEMKKINPGAEQNIFNSMANIYLEYLPKQFDTKNKGAMLHNFKNEDKDF